MGNERTGHKTEGRTALVIGAGIGGLSAAIRLALAGWQVTVLEKNDIVGGKMGQISQDGYLWDTGPSVITMRHVFEDLFTAAGRELEDYLDLVAVDPLTRYFYPDGVVLDASSDPDEMTARIAEMAPGDVQGYQDYLAYAERIHRITGPVFIYNQPPRPRDFARVPVTEWLQADPLRTMDEGIRSHVESDHLRQLLGRFATYVGGSPYAAPATLNVIAHVELNGGVWYPRGGIYKIAEAMAQLAEDVGVTICTDTPVERIDVASWRARGVVLADGTHMAADVVVSNLDVTTTYENLLPDSAKLRRTLKKLQDFEPSCSGFIMLLGIEGQYEGLAHHNIFFSSDYRREFDSIFKQQQPPDEPTVYVSITSKTDADHAPDGHENWFVLVNAPALSPAYDWSTSADGYRDLVLDRMAAFGYDVRDRIRSEQIITPVDLSRMSGAYRGALYGPSANSRWTVFRRPHNRSSDVRGLYFAGGTTHPGGGVPMVTLSGKTAAEMVVADNP